MKNKSKRIISMMFAILLMIMNFKAVPITALNDFNININFASDYSSEQDYVEYKLMKEIGLLFLIIHQFQ